MGAQGDILVDTAGGSVLTLSDSNHTNRFRQPGAALVPSILNQHLHVVLRQYHCVGVVSDLRPGNRIAASIFGSQKMPRDGSTASLACQNFLF